MIAITFLTAIVTVSGSNQIGVASGLAGPMLQPSVSPSGAGEVSAGYTFDPAASPDLHLDGSFGAMRDQSATQAQANPFGIDGSRFWYVSAAAASDFDKDNFGRVGAGVSYFLADDVSIDFEFNMFYFAQDGDNAFAVNGNLIFRWHFWHDEDRTWTVYADAGAGMLIATEEVPMGGSNFNFTPQAGVGASFALSDDSRLFVGVRWHHVSNARLYEDNPGQDYAMVYAMLAWPF